MRCSSAARMTTLSSQSVVEMSVRRAPDGGLSTRQKLTLFHGSGMSAEAALGTPDDQINFDLMLTNGVKAINICTAGIRPMALKQLGVAQASQLRRLGFDALHLVDPVWCQEANAAFGAAEVIQAFLVSPQDAVSLSGSEAVATLNLSTEQLLEACAGAPTEAISVLQQSTDAAPLKGVRASTLLDTGLRAPQLKQLGYNLATVTALSELSGDQIGKFGFSL